MLSFHRNAGESVGLALNGIHVFADAFGIHHGHADAHIVPDGAHLRRQHGVPVDIVKLAAAVAHGMTSEKFDKEKEYFIIIKISSFFRKGQ